MATAQEVNREIDRLLARRKQSGGLSHDPDASGSILTLTDRRKAQREAKYAKSVARALKHAYPGHPWQIGVDVSAKNGLVIIHIKIPALDGLWGFSIKTDKGPNSPSIHKLVVNGAGELLERWGISRGKARADEYAAVKRTFTGAAEHE